MRNLVFTFSFHSGGEGKMLSGLVRHMLKQSEFSTMSSIDILSVNQGIFFIIEFACINGVKNCLNARVENNANKMNIKETKFYIIEVLCRKLWVALLVWLFICSFRERFMQSVMRLALFFVDRNTVCTISKISLPGNCALGTSGKMWYTSA